MGFIVNISFVASCVKNFVVEYRSSPSVCIGAVVFETELATGCSGAELEEENGAFGIGVTNGGAELEEKNGAFGVVTNGGAELEKENSSFWLGVTNGGAELDHVGGNTPAPLFRG